MLVKNRFSGAALGEFDISPRADLSKANLSKANLSEANLSWTDLRWANLTEANLTEADLSRADLSGAKGLLSASQWLAENFETDELGVIVYKRIGETEYLAPSHWRIAPGEFLVEVVNPLPTCGCASGVNFGTRRWCEENYKDAVLWHCRIHWMDLADVVVPYNTDGKARCGRLELLEKIEC